MMENPTGRCASFGLFLTLLAAWTALGSPIRIGVIPDKQGVAAAQEDPAKTVEWLLANDSVMNRLLAFGVYARTSPEGVHRFPFLAELRLEWDDIEYVQLSAGFHLGMGPHTTVKLVPKAASRLREFSEARQGRRIAVVLGDRIVTSNILSTPLRFQFGMNVAPAELVEHGYPGEVRDWATDLPAFDGDLLVFDGSRHLVIVGVTGIAIALAAGAGLVLGLLRPLKNTSDSQCPLPALVVAFVGMVGIYFLLVALGGGIVAAITAFGLRTPHFVVFEQHNVFSMGLGVVYSALNLATGIAFLFWRRKVAYLLVRTSMQAQSDGGRN